MPLSLNIPLPGPFSYSRRVGSSRPTLKSPWFWITVGWWLVPIVYAITYLFVGIVWALYLPLRWSWTACRWAYRQVIAPRP